MKVLMLSTDKRILEPHSRANARMRAYSMLFEELHVIVMGRGKQDEIKFREGSLAIYNALRAQGIRTIGAARQLGQTVLKNTDGFVITTQDPFETGIVGASLSKRTRVPLHVQIHTDLFNPEFGKDFKNKIRLFFAPKIINQAKSIRVVSERVKKSLEEKGHKIPVTVLPIVEEPKNPDEYVDLKEKYKGFDYYVLMVSRLAKEKNIKLALDALQILLAAVPKTLLVVVGSGPEEEELKSYARQKKIFDHVRFEGWKNNPKSYFETADAFLGTSLYEGYGLALMEARNYGLPVVSTDVGVIGFELQTGNYVRQANDATEIASELVKAKGLPKEPLNPTMSISEYYSKYKLMLESVLSA